MGLPTGGYHNMKLLLQSKWEKNTNLKQWAPDFTDGIHKSQGRFENADIIWSVWESLPLPHNPIEGSFMGNPSSLWTSR